MTRRPIFKHLLTGAIAGAIGTLAMDLLLYRRYRSGGGKESFTDWEFSAATSSFDDAGAPAQVGRRLASAVGIDLPPKSAGLTNNAVHWATGMQWGVIYGATLRGTSRSPLWGPPLGVVAWGAAYAILPALGVYKPIWEYDAKTLGKDLSAHLVFGSAAGLAVKAMTSSAE